MKKTGSCQGLGEMGGSWVTADAKMGRCQTDPRESSCLARAPQEQVATGEIKIETGKQAPSRDRGK